MCIYRQKTIRIHSYWYVLLALLLPGHAGMFHSINPLFSFFFYFSSALTNLKHTSLPEVIAALFLCTDALQASRHDSINCIPFVVTCNPALSHIYNILRIHDHFNILLSFNRCRKFLNSCLSSLTDAILTFVTS